MDAASNQQILFYFIEEAKEHLETLEKGIIELPDAIEDEERVNEMFRAAHSIKGGAAMLGYRSIQKTAHKLEDAFKVIRDLGSKMEVDPKLENLLLKVYDVLHLLIEKLQAPVGLQNEEAQVIMQEADPAFVELQNYIQKMAIEPDDEIEVQEPVFASTSSPLTETKAPTNIHEQVKKLLKQMLEIFKQKPSAENRQQLQSICGSLTKLAPNEAGWQTLLKTVQGAIANPRHSFHVLAPVVIKELKRGSDYIVLGKPEKISPTTDLQQLANSKLPQVLVTVEPKAAAEILRKAFNGQQISHLIQLLQGT